MNGIFRLKALAWAVLFLPAVEAHGQVAHGQVARGQVTIAVQTTCEAMANSFCQGAFGFRINKAETWQAGPAPSGHAVSGTLTPSEQSVLTAAATNLLDSQIPTTQDCKPTPQMPPGVSETVVVNLSEREITLYGAGGKLSAACGSAESAASKIFALADQIMRHYYPRPM